METEKIICSGTEHTIEVRPVTVLFNAAQKDIMYLDRVSITPEMTLKHFNQINDIDSFTAILFRIVVNDYASPVTKKQIQGSVLAFKHLIGLFSLSLKLMVEGKKVVWQYPESFLHPKYQGNIADVMILLGDTDKFVHLIRCVQRGYFDDFILGQEGQGSFVLKRLGQLTNDS